MQSREVRLRTKSGEERDMVVSLVMVNLGGEPCVVSLARDITSEKHAQRTLEESAQRYRTATHAEPVIRIPSISVTSKRALDVPPIPGTRTGSYSLHSERFRKSYGFFRNRYEAGRTGCSDRILRVGPNDQRRSPDPGVHDGFPAP